MGPLQQQQAIALGIFDPYLAAKGLLANRFESAGSLGKGLLEAALEVGAGQAERQAAVLRRLGPLLGGLVDRLLLASAEHELLHPALAFNGHVQHLAVEARQGCWCVTGQNPERCAHRLGVAAHSMPEC